MEIEWLQDELVTGFQKLYCLGLERTPAAEVLPGTAGVWVETLADRFDWDRERDTARIRRAFVVLAGTRRSWPLPQDFMDAMPRPEQPALTRQSVPANPERAKAAIAEVRRALSGKDAAAEQGVAP